MKRAWLCRPAIAALATLAAACSDAAPTAAEEVAGELRALRLLLAQQPRAAAGLAGPAGSTADVQAALAPLREALDALAVSQRQLAERQVALAQEMQRWSQLLVDAVGGTRAEEAKATAAKLRELEASLKSQDTRHREVEALIQGALERTADQLDAFLKRLQGIAPGGAPASPNTPGGGAPAGGAGGGEREDAEASSTPALGASATRGSLRWWWLGVTGLAVGAATFFLRRAKRASAMAPTAPAPALPPPAPAERSVEEIWAAAALLGEAVGRLRQTVDAGRSPTTPGEPGPAPTAAMDPVEPPLDDLFVIADDELAADGAAAPTVAVAAAPAAARPNALETMLARVPGAVPPDRILAALATERLVLRRPEPTWRTLDGTLEVTFHVLPGTSPGERSRLLQRLRDAVRGVG